MDEDLATFSREQLAAEVVKLRNGIRAHRDASGQGLCWHHPGLWSLLPEKVQASIAVPEWPQFMRGCVRYRQSLDDQLPATLSREVMTHLLREQMGYDGVVLTDDLEMHAIVDHYGPGDAAVRALLAGCDMLLICKEREREIAAFEAVEKAVASGAIDTARLDQSVGRIQRVKQRYLLPYRPAVISDAKLIAGCRTHQALLHSIRQANVRMEKRSAARVV